ncbi:MAG: SCO family protein [Bacteroidia bacterium]|nr:SCO family protein [Bacteroidia bacterium]
MKVFMHKTNNKLLIFTSLSIFIISCSSGKKTLPILGFRDVSPNGDTIYHVIPDFVFTNQEGQPVSQKTVAGKIYVTDFFFTSCPSICPKMKAQMIRIHDAFMDNDSLILLSHSIDPVFDSVAVLKDYADRLGIKTAKWHLLTGNKEEIYGIAEKYLVSVAEDGQAPGGFIHSGHFILVDTQRRIRGYYDGTREEEVNQLMSDIQVLMNEGKE